MKKEITVTDKTVEEALAKAVAELGVDSTEVTYEVLELPKKGLFGIGATPARVHVTYDPAEDDLALGFINRLISDMGLDAAAEATETAPGEKMINITGSGAGILIGHHGYTLDSLQYLCSLAANKKDSEGKRNYVKITLDIEGYRAKREESLRSLAHRMSAKVLKSRRQVALEPMNPYERRIIHSEVQNIEGVTTYSIGAENNRRIVVCLDDGTAPRRPPRSPRQPDAE